MNFSTDGCDGWFIDIQHAGSANQVLIASVSSQTISSGATSYSTVMVLSRSGESARLVSDGGNWRVTSHASPHIKNAQGIITVTDRLTSPPGSEVNGSIYLISAAPSGAWASFSAGDLVQYTSSAWVRFIPQEGCRYGLPMRILSTPARDRIRGCRWQQARRPLALSKRQRLPRSLPKRQTDTPMLLTLSTNLAWQSSGQK